VEHRSREMQLFNTSEASGLELVNLQALQNDRVPDCDRSKWRCGLPYVDGAGVTQAGWESCEVLSGWRALSSNAL
jgi:hypothetical protein